MFNSVHLLTSAIQGAPRTTSTGGSPRCMALPSLASRNADQVALPEVGANRRNDLALPSGIASMEHWLDLNA